MNASLHTPARRSGVLLIYNKKGGRLSAHFHPGLCRRYNGRHGDAMEQTYLSRKRGMRETSTQAAGSPAALSPDALRAGTAQPTQEMLGRPVDLPGAIRAKMESSFGADLSAVRLYESQAVADAGAQAVAQGSRIAFAPGALDFVSASGQALLGHELSHVVSQARGEVTGSGFLNDRALEARADREGAMAAAGQPVYAGPVATALSPVSAASAGGPMQARKAHSKKTMMKSSFDLYGDAKTARKDPRTAGMVFRSLYDPDGTITDTGTNPEDIISGIGNAQFSPQDFVNPENDSHIFGNVYRPDPAKANGKHVVLYSGSGGSNQDQMSGQVQTYLQNGYTVHAYDYGGFGKSTAKDNKFSERTMQQDAQHIFNFVRTTEGLKNKDVLLHGFSMGGSMAAHVARNAMIQEAQANNGIIDEEDKLGGLILESSMKNTKNAVENVGMGSLAGSIGSTQGDFDTSSALTELSELDPELPVNFVTANRGEKLGLFRGGWSGDHLDEANTGLYKQARKQFQNTTFTRSFSQDHLDQGKLQHAMPAIQNNQRSAPSPSKISSLDQDRKIGERWAANNAETYYRDGSKAIADRLRTKYEGPGYKNNTFSTSIHNPFTGENGLGLNTSRVLTTLAGSAGEGISESRLENLFDNLMGVHKTDLREEDQSAASQKFSSGVRQLKRIYYTQLKRLQSTYGTTLSQMHPEDVLRQVGDDFNAQFALLQDTEQMLKNMPQYFDLEHNEQDQEFKRLNDYYNDVYGYYNQYAMGILNKEVSGAPFDAEQYVGKSTEYQRALDQEGGIGGPRLTSKQLKQYEADLKKRMKSGSWQGSQFGRYRTG